MNKIANTLIYPFNFVPLSESRNKTDFSSNSTLLNGYIEYELTTKTPLFIPNTSTNHAFTIHDSYSKDNKTIDHPSYEFFSYDDLTGKTNLDKTPPKRPIIPGSEIRGALRSVYESMTNSCLSHIDLKQVLSKRTPECYQSGILFYFPKERQLKLYKAEDMLYRKDDNEGSRDFQIKSYNEINSKDGSSIQYEILMDRKDARAKNLVEIKGDTVCTEKNYRSIGYLLKGMSGPKLSKSKGSRCQDGCPQYKQTCAGEDGDECYKLEKHCAHVFICAKSKKGMLLDPIMAWASDSNSNGQINILDKIQNILNIYKNNSEDHSYSEYRDTFNAFRKNISEEKFAGIPIYYSEIRNESSKVDGESIFYLSPACITREVYEKTVKELIKDFAPCTDKNNLCPACALFGMVNSGNGVTSRIRFSDLEIDPAEQRDIYEPIVCLPELSTPKLSSTELYLRRPTVKQGETLMNWTYDYYVVLDEDNRPHIRFYDNAEISGRKMYWHSLYAYEKVVKERQPNSSKSNAIKITERNETVRPIKKGIKFHGKLYFSRLNNTEMNQMIALLNMSSNNSYGIKMGHGKPIGLGSVELKIKNVYHHKRQYRDDCIVNIDEKLPISGSIEKDFPNTSVLKYLRFDALMDGYTSYPGTDNSEESEGFNWFVHNRQQYKLKDGSINLDTKINGAQRRSQVKYLHYLEPFSGLNVSSINRKHAKNTYLVGYEYTGTISDYNDRKTKVKVQLDDGNTVMIYYSQLKKHVKPGKLDNAYPLKEKITVVYCGKEIGSDGKEHETWKEKGKA